jgi:hypothetical protein
MSACGSQADIEALPCHIRFTPKSGHSAELSLLCATDVSTRSKFSVGEVAPCGP